MPMQRMRNLRRLFDMVCAAFGIVILSPIFFIIGLAIKFEDGGNIFYSQRRMGKGFKEFRLLKFRSMIPDADRAGLLTGPKDSRITRVGKFLRRYKLDELPQLFNVIRGDMQLVGPRPEVSRYVEMFPTEYARLLKERPGITDPASLAFRDEEAILSGENTEAHYVAEILPEKLTLSGRYLETRTFASDLKIIVRTVFGSNRFENIPSSGEVASPLERKEEFPAHREAAP